MNNRTWHKGPPPEVGWWNASPNRTESYWRWWDGKTWSIGVGDFLDADTAAQLAATPTDSTYEIEWTDYWPRPGYSRSTGEKLEPAEQVDPTDGGRKHDAALQVLADEIKPKVDQKVKDMCASIINEPANGTGKAAAAQKILDRFGAKSIDPTPPALDEYHAHEALDRTYMLCGTFGDYILDHPYVTSDPDLLRRAKKVAKHLSALYQEIGERHL